MKWLITGCHGFVGGSVGRFVALHGHEVLGIGLASQPDLDWPGSYSQADVAHEDLAPMIDGFSPGVVLHAAGSASVAASLMSPLSDLRAAVLTWANLLDSIRRSAARPLILFPSSAAVYGNPQQLPVGEDAAVAPISPYGFHKAACELLAEEYRSCFGLDVIVARIFSLFGPRQRRLLVWEIFRQVISQDAEIVLKGSGDETRDYLYIEDAAEILLRLCQVARGTVTVVNLGSGVGTSVRNLATEIVGALGVSKRVRALGQARPGDPLAWRADTQLLRGLGIESTHALGDGLRACVREWQCT